MPHSYTHLYVHFVWATWNRAPLITPAVEPPLYACIAKECRDLKCDVIAIGGTEDHLHAFVRLHSTVSVAALAKAPDATLAVLEVDEKFMPAMLEKTGARVVVLLNLSRDQMDRAAEIWMLARRWREALYLIQTYTLPTIGVIVLALAVYLLARFAINRRLKRQRAALDQAERQQSDDLVQV